MHWYGQPILVKIGINIEDDEVPITKRFIIVNSSIKTKLEYLRRKRYAFVISGESKNISSTKGSLLTVRATIYSISDSKKLYTKRVYAGNTFTKKEIMRAKTEEILDSKYLQSGKSGINWNIAPQKKLPFMIVFYLNKKIDPKKLRIELKVESVQ